LHTCNITCKRYDDTMLSDVCVKAKCHQLPFISSKTVYSHPSKLVYIDIWGPTPILATNGAKYYVSFLYAYSKYTRVYMFILKLWQKIKLMLN